MFNVSLPGYNTVTIDENEALKIMRKKIEEGAKEKKFQDKKNGNEKDAVLFVINWEDS
jgi:hypothetical protein